MNTGGVGMSFEQRRTNAELSWKAYGQEEGVFDRTRSRALSGLGKSGMRRDSSAFKTRETQIQTAYDKSLDELRGGRTFKELQDFYVEDVARGQTDEYQQNLRVDSGGESIDWDENIQAEVLQGYKDKVDLTKMDAYYTDLYGDTTQKEQKQFDGKGSKGSVFTREQRDKRAAPNETSMESMWI